MGFEEVNAKARQIGKKNMETEAEFSSVSLEGKHTMMKTLR